MDNEKRKKETGEDFGNCLSHLFRSNGYPNLGRRDCLAYPRRRVSKKRANFWHVPRGTLLEKNLSKTLDSKISARGRQYGSEVSTRRCTVRHFKCKSYQCQVFFAGVDKIILRAQGLRQYECEAEVQKWPGAIIRATGAHVKYYLHDCAN